MQNTTQKVIFAAYYLLCICKLAIFARTLITQLR